MEFLDVVDDDDRVVGRQPRDVCLEKALLHRAVTILLFDESKRLYIQKRADSLAWYPGYWTLSVAGHVSSGESYEDGARRELREELSVDCPLTLVTKIRTPDYPYGRFTEREFVAVFEGRIARPKIVLSSETKEGQFVSFREFVEEARRESGKFTPDSMVALNRYVEMKGSG